MSTEQTGGHVRYTRSGNGRIIHRRLGCRWADKGTVAWNFADDMSIQDIINAAYAAGVTRDLRFCYFCFGRIPNMEMTAAHTGR